MAKSDTPSPSNDMITSATDAGTKDVSEKDLSPTEPCSSTSPTSPSLCSSDHRSDHSLEEETEKDSSSKTASVVPSKSHAKDDDEREKPEKHESRHSSSSSRSDRSGSRHRRSRSRSPSHRDSHEKSSSSRKSSSRRSGSKRHREDFHRYDPHSRSRRSESSRGSSSSSRDSRDKSSSHGSSRRDSHGSSSSSSRGSSSRSGSSRYRSRRSSSRSPERERRRHRSNSTGRSESAVPPSASPPKPTPAEVALLESPAAALLPPNLNDHQKLAILRARQFAAEQQQKRMLEHQRMMLIHQRAIMAAQAVSAAANVPMGMSALPAAPVFASPPTQPQLQPQPQQHKAYVGSLHYDLTEDDIKSLFSSVGTVLSVNIGREPQTGVSKGYAFVTFPDAACVQRAIETLDGHELAGRPIRVGHPRSASTAVAATPSMSLPTGSVAPAVVNPARLFVHGVHRDINSENLRAVFEAFGTVNSCELIPDVSTGNHRGYGFVVYDSVSSAQEAMKELDGMEMAGRSIHVKVANPSSGQAGSSAADAATAAMMAANSLGRSAPGDALSKEENLTIGGVNQRLALMQKLARSSQPTSRVLGLKNMLTPEDLDEDLEGEITSEVSKYGVVQRLVIFHEDEGLPSATVKVFILFATEQDATVAQEKLHGRWFGGSQIIAEFWDERRFEANDFRD